MSDDHSVLCVLKWIVNPCEQNSPDEPYQLSPQLIAGNIEWNLTLQTLRNLDDDICQLQIGIASRNTKEPLEVCDSFVSCSNKWGATHIALTDIITVKPNEFTLFSPIDVSLRCFNYEAVEITLDFVVHNDGYDEHHKNSESNMSSPCSWYSANSYTPSPVGGRKSPIEFRESPMNIEIYQQPRVMPHRAPPFNVPPPPATSPIYKFLYGTLASDVTLTCQDRYFLCHKSVLSSKSTVFAAMFASNLCDVLNPIVPLACIDYVTLFEIIQYIYTGTAPELAKKACRLLRPAAMYRLNELKIVCESFACEQLTIDNAVELLLLSFCCETDQLKEIALEFVTQHIDEMLQMNEFAIAMQNNGPVCFEIMKKALKK